MMVGIAVMLTGFGLLAAMVELLSVQPTVAKAIEVFISIQLNYVGNRLFTERGRDVGSWWSGLVRNNLTRATTAGVTMGAFWVLTQHLHVYYMVASAISVAGAMAMNYMFHRLWVFPDPVAADRWRRWAIWSFKKLALLVAAGAATYVTWEWLGVRGALYVVIVAIVVFMIFVAVSSMWLSLYAWHTPENMQSAGFGEPLEPKHGFSVIVPVRGAGINIVGPTISALVAQDHPDIEIVMVVSGDDDEATRASAEALRDRYPDLVQVAYAYGKKNKPLALMAALPYTSKEFVGIIDAESIASPKLKRMIDSTLQRTGADIVQGGVQLMNYRDSWYSLINCMEYYRWFKSRLRWHALRNFITLGGNSLVFRRDALVAVGGWDTNNLAEDCEIGVRMSVAGYKVAVAYDPEHVTRESTPDSMRRLVKQRRRWMQGFLQTYRKGVWRELDTWRMRALARYTLLMPLAQAVFGLLLPLSIAAALWLNVPTVLALFTFVPLAAFLVTLGADMVALQEFGKDFGLKVGLRDHARLVLGTFPYQFLLSIAAVGAVVRQIRGQDNWELTVQAGQHHKSLELATAKGAA
jgi:cellulose synthase/poly-beta-1,6-N-acetylglucosamine synthase-like glycosyltransferase